MGTKLPNSIILLPNLFYLSLLSHSFIHTYKVYPNASLKLTPIQVVLYFLHVIEIFLISARKIYLIKLYIIILTWNIALQLLGGLFFMVIIHTLDQNIICASKIRNNFWYSIIMIIFFSLSLQYSWWSSNFAIANIVAPNLFT